MFSLSEIDSSWHSIFEPHLGEIEEIFQTLGDKEITPSRQFVFSAFSLPITKVKVLILGQDPYPAKGIADGLAFSSGLADVIPASLRNIFKEYCEDLSYTVPSTNNLRPWLKEGVMLLNTSLTTEIGKRDTHKSLGWNNLISSVLLELSKRDVVAILWGNTAKSAGSAFPYKIESAHPSPLSAHRGFFGSKPFSSANEILLRLGKDSVNWKLL
jgi:uracil-DNA glycosylase